MGVPAYTLPHGVAGSGWNTPWVAAQVHRFLDTLDEAVYWYAQQAPGLGDSFVVEFLRTIQRIERHPQGWHSLSNNTPLLPTA